MSCYNLFRHDVLSNGQKYGWASYLEMQTLYDTSALNDVEEVAWAEAAVGGALFLC